MMLICCCSEASKGCKDKCHKGIMIKPDEVAEVTPWKRKSVSYKVKLYAKKYGGLGGVKEDM